jgi:signal peptidase II
MLFGTMVVVLIIDQWTKYLVHTKMHLGQSIHLINNFFAFTYVQNKGAAFGFLHSAPDWFREPFFIITPLVALFLIGVFFYKLPDEEKLMGAAFSLIVSGAIGNLIDRLRFGYVIDFLDFYWKTYHYPAFNVADSCIVIGVSFLIIHSFFQGKVCLDNKAPDQKAG